MILDAAVRRHSIAALALVLAPPLELAAEGRDGRLFDTGVTMSRPAPGAPAQLGQATFLVGEWDVSCTLAPSEGEAVEVRAVSSITWMNRGHDVMERAFSADADGTGQASHDIRLLVFNEAGGAWSYGEATTWRETTRAMQGPPTPDAIVLFDAIRPGGGPSLELRRRTYRDTGPRALTVTHEVSTDIGESWTTRVSCAYARRPQRDSVLRFGGRQEGDRIVLHTFDVDSTGVLSRFVFHDIGEDGYRWYAERSQDRGQTFQKTWTIDVTFRDATGS